MQLYIFPDEIDGAPVQSIEFLIKFASDQVVVSKSKGKNKAKNLLRRPIICICNDMYVPALRQLRQIAFVVSFPQIESGRLADRYYGEPKMYIALTPFVISDCIRYVERRKLWSISHLC